MRDNLERSSAHQLRTQRQPVHQDMSLMFSQQQAHQRRSPSFRQDRCSVAHRWLSKFSHVLTTIGPSLPAGLREALSKTRIHPHDKIPEAQSAASLQNLTAAHGVRPPAIRNQKAAAPRHAPAARPVSRSSLSKRSCTSRSRHPSRTPNFVISNS